MASDTRRSTDFQKGICFLKLHLHTTHYEPACGGLNENTSPHGAYICMLGPQLMDCLNRCMLVRGSVSPEDQVVKLSATAQGHRQAPN